MSNTETSPTDLPKKVPIIIKNKQKEHAKKWRDNNKDVISANNYCYRNGLDWNKYKKEHGFDKLPQPSKNRIEHKSVDGIELKWCNHCDDYLSLDNFSKSTSTWDNLRTHCKLYDKECKAKKAKNTTNDTNANTSDTQANTTQANITHNTQTN